DRVLTRGGQYMELVRGATTDGAGIGKYRAELQPQAGEYAAVRVVHHRVLAIQIGIVEVERIGVLHQELARAHNPETGPDLVAELGLDLIETRRQLLVASQFLTREIGNDFFV